MKVKKAEKVLTTSKRAKRKTNELDIIIDTPKGSRNKYEFDEKRSRLKLSGMLTVGSVFPFDSGFIPDTVGGDGDPLDVLLLMDEPAFPGCLVAARLIGVVKANQTEKGKTNRNDRLIAVATDSVAHSHVRSLNDVNKSLVDQIEHFSSYNQIKGKKIEPLSPRGSNKSMAVVAASKSERRKRESKSAK